MKENSMNRRHALLYFGITGLGLCAGAGNVLAVEKFEIARSEAEWKSMLTPEQYAVLRQEKTEAPNSSPLLKETRSGTYNCAGCDLPVYSSATKYESNTGWPSFFDVLPSSTGTKEDNTFFTSRNEVHCKRCGSHLGHVFNDGPEPTGLRYCMNGVALNFKLASA
jgi:peptide-methionine (R)-S-oxide reductase